MSPTEFNLRHLRALAALVRLGSFSAAAKAIGITQPAVTQAIARLEALTGTRLLDRSGGKAVPTDAGILLSARGETAASLLAEPFRPQRKGGIGGRAGADADITMAQVSALLAVADNGSYVAGAAALGLAQPSLHRSVGELVRLTGLALVERRGRGVALSTAGEQLAAAFRLGVAELQAALDEMAVLAGRDQGAIRIGAHSAAFGRGLATAIARFLTEHPPVVIEVEHVEGAQGADRLRGGHVDALVTLAGPELGEAFAAEPLADDPLVIAGRSGHPLAGGGVPGLVRLAQFGWALPPRGSNEHDAWERLFLDGGLFPPRANVTCPSVPSLLELAAHSELLTVASRHQVEASRGRLAVVSGPLPASRRLVLATRTGWAPTPAQATFLEEVRAAASGRLLAF